MLRPRVDRGFASRSRVLSKPVFLLLFFGLFLSAFCKLQRLGSRELWLDETYSVFVAHLPFHDLIRQTVGDVHPPLFYILIWAWVRLVGDKQTALRLFPVLLSLCATLMMFFMARRWLGNAGGAFAAVLLAFSPMLFVYSLEVRMYMLSILVFICLLLLHKILAIEQNQAKWLPLAYGLVGALLFYVHYIGVFLLLGLFADWSIASRLAKKSLLRMCAAGLLTLILIAPWLPVLVKQRAHKLEQKRALFLSYSNPDSLTFGTMQPDFNAPIKPGTMMKIEAAAYGVYPARSPLIAVFCAVPLLIALAGGGFLLIKGDDICRLFVLVSLTVTIGVVALHLDSTRYLLPALPVFILLVARVVQYGMQTTRSRPLALALGALVFCVYAIGFFRQATLPHARPWENVVSVLKQNYKPDDRVIFDAAYGQVPFDYFARQAQFHPQEAGFPNSTYDWWNEQPFKGWGGPIITHSDLDRFIAGLQTSGPTSLWLVVYEDRFYDPHDALLARLRRFGQVEEMPMPKEEADVTSRDEEVVRLFRVLLNQPPERFTSGASKL